MCVEIKSQEIDGFLTKSPCVASGRFARPGSDALRKPSVARGWLSTQWEGWKIGSRCVRFEVNKVLEAGKWMVAVQIVKSEEVNLL
jgi:hypothetical protein